MRGQGHWRPSDRRAWLAARLVCAGAAPPAFDDPYPFRCPATAGDDTYQVLRRILDVSAVGFPTSGVGDDGGDPYLRYRRLFHSYHVARDGGMQDAEYCALVAGSTARWRRRRPRLPCDAVRQGGGPQRAAGFRGRWRDLGQGRDGQRVRLTQGPPPVRATRSPRSGRASWSPDRRIGRPRDRELRDAASRRPSSRQPAGASFWCSSVDADPSWCPG